MKLGRKEIRKGKTKRASLIATPSFGRAIFLWVMLLLLLIGCVRAKPTLTYQPLHETTFQSRTQPASLSQKSAETLIQEGFVKVGYLSLNILKEICKHY